MEWHHFRESQSSFVKAPHPPCSICLACAPLNFGENPGEKEAVEEMQHIFHGCYTSRSKPKTTGGLARGKL